MKKDVRKFFALIMTLVMMVTLFPAATLTAFADGAATPTDLNGTKGGGEEGGSEGVG